MASKRADELMHDKVVEEAHRQWEAEKIQQMATARERELRRRRSLVLQRRKQEQHKVSCFVVVFRPTQPSIRPGQCSRKRVQQLKKNIKSHVFWI